MRAGDSMVQVARELLPDISIGKILIQRNEETAMPVLLYSKLPPRLERNYVLLLDPMLATGGKQFITFESF